MDQKQEVIQMIGQINNAQLLNQIKELLVGKNPSKAQENYQIPESVWEEVQQLRTQRKNGK